MFKIGGEKQYKVIYVRGGQGKNGGYTFLSIEDALRENQKFGDRMKINVWGEDLSQKIVKDSYVSVLGVNEIGLVNSEADGKTYKNLTIVCSPDQIISVEPKQSAEPKAELEPINDQDLPF